MRNNLTRFVCKGVNVIKIINLCTSYGIEIYDLSKISSTCIEFSLKDDGLKIFQKLDLSSYEIELLKDGGKQQLKRLFIARFGLILGLVVSIIFVIFINNRLLNIKVYGLSNIDKSEIINSVNEFGLNTFSNLEFDKKELETYLAEKFDLSLVSVITKGNTLIISLKEEIDNNISSNEAIISPYNMVIKSISVYSGTTKLSSGSIVYKGDILVYPYTIINGEQVNIKPCAEIEAEVFTTNSYTYLNKEKNLQRTGNNKTTESTFYLGNLKIFSTQQNINYEKYEEETVETYISKYFLPIRVCKKVTYELEEKIVERDFESEKDFLINNLLVETYKLIDKTLVVNDEKIDITKISDGYIINIYLKSSISLNYKD